MHEELLGIIINFQFKKMTTLINFQFEKMKTRGIYKEELV